MQTKNVNLYPIIDEKKRSLDPVGVDDVVEAKDKFTDGGYVLESKEELKEYMDTDRLKISKKETKTSDGKTKILHIYEDPKWKEMKKTVYVDDIDLGEGKTLCITAEDWNRLCISNNINVEKKEKKEKKRKKRMENKEEYKENTSNNSKKERKKDKKERHIVSKIKKTLK